MPMEDRKIRVYHSRANQNDPSIILQGKWLAACGFAAGDYLSVKCSENQLIISIQEKFKDTKEK